MSVGMQVLSPDLIRLQTRLNKLANFDFHKLLDDVGGIVESQTRRRLHEEKTSPSGVAWPGWSDAYAKTRHGNQSLLESSGSLIESITYEVLGNDLYVGSNLVYAHNHDAGTTVPQREFLGLSAENEKEIVETVEKFFDAHGGL